MKLIPNWKRVATKSHSVRAMVVGWIIFNLPDVIYLTTQVDLNPSTFSIMGNALFIYGLVGRLVDQGIGDA